MNDFEHLRDSISNSISKVEGIPEIKVGSFETVELKNEVVPLLEEARSRLSDLEYINDNLDGIRNEIIRPVFGVINAKSKYSNVLAILGIFFGAIGVVLTALQVSGPAPIVVPRQAEELLSGPGSKPDGLALMQTARLHLVKGEFNQGKAFLARALVADPAIDTLEARALDMMHPDFPFIEIPEIGYRQGPAGISRDSRHIVYFGEQEVVYFDDEKDKAFPLGPREDQDAHIELSASGRYAVVMGRNTSVSLYDTKQLRLLARVAWSDKSSGEVPIAAFSSDEKEIAFFNRGTGGSIQFRKTAGFDSIAAAMPVGAPVYSLLYGRETGQMLLGERDRVTLRERPTGKVVHSWQASGRVFSLALSPDGRLLAAGGWRKVHVYDLVNGELLQEFDACPHNVADVGFLRDGRFVAWASPAFRSGLFEVQSGRRIQDFPLGDSMASFGDKQALLIGGRFVDLARLRELEELDGPSELLLEPTISSMSSNVPPTIKAAVQKIGRRSKVQKLWASRDKVAYTTDDGHVFVGRPEAQSIDILTSRYRKTVAVSFLHSTGRLMRLGVSGNGMVGVVEMFNLGDGKKIEKLMRDPPESIALSPDERLAAVVDRMGRLWLFLTDDLNRPALLLERSGEVREAFFSVNGKVLAVSTGARWREFDIRRLERQQLLGEAQYGYRIEGLRLSSRPF